LQELSVWKEMLPQMSAWAADQERVGLRDAIERMDGWNWQDHRHGSLYRKESGVDLQRHYQVTIHPGMIRTG
jgi:hypothetical protein